MTKTEACKFLKCSERTLERYIAAGKLSVQYVKGKTRSVAKLNGNEVHGLKSKIDKGLSRPQVIQPRVEMQVSGPREATPTNTVQSMARFGGVPNTALASVAALLTQLRPGVGIADKLLLTLKESAQLSGLARGVLREEIRAGRLKGKVRGRGFKVKRSDLEAYIAHLK